MFNVYVQSYGYEMTAPIRLFIRGAGPDACSYKRSRIAVWIDYRLTVCAFDFVPFLQVSRFSQSTPLLVRKDRRPCWSSRELLGAKIGVGFVNCAR